MWRSPARPKMVWNSPAAITSTPTSPDRSFWAMATARLSSTREAPPISSVRCLQTMEWRWLPMGSSEFLAITSITTRPPSPSGQAESSNPTAPTNTATATAGRRCPMPASPSIDMAPERQRASWSTRRRSIMGQVIRKIALSLALVALAWPLLAAAPAQAGSTRTWVSGATTADDMNPCSRTAPCKTFAGALANTLPGGEINCLDPGDFGSVTITFSLTISCEVGTAGIQPQSEGLGITIDAAATDVVVLRGLDIDGQGPANLGINIVQAKEVHIEKCSIRNFRRAGGNSVAIYVFPSSTTFLYVTDAVISDSGVGVVLSGTGGYKIASLKNVMITGSVSDGLSLSSTNSYANVTDSIISGNHGTAVIAFVSSATANIDRSTIANN